MAKKGKRARRREAAGGAAAAPGPEGAASPVIVPPAQTDGASSHQGPEGSAQAAAPSGAPSRALANALIVAFLAYQVAMPLRYYLGGRGYDERFSWRMFSTLRMQQCKVRVSETVDGDERAVALNKEIQVAWIGMLERYRRPVVDKLLVRRCQDAKATSVVYRRSCRDTDGSELPDTTVALDCKSGKLVADEGAQGTDGAPQEAAP